MFGYNRGEVMAMPEQEEMNLLGATNDVWDRGQQDVLKKYGWLPQTLQKEKIFSGQGLTIEVRWQEKDPTIARQAMFYYKVTVIGKDSRHPASIMLEAEDVFLLTQLLSEIQSKGIKAVDLQKREQAASAYLRRDTLPDLAAEGFSKVAMDRFLEKDKARKQQEAAFAVNSLNAYDSCTDPSCLLSVSKREMKAIAWNISKVKIHYLKVYHTPMHKRDKPKHKPFRVAITEYAGEVRFHNGNTAALKKCAKAELSQAQFSDAVTAMWNAYKDWWNRK